MENADIEDVVAALGYLCLGSRFKRIGERLQADTLAIVAEQSGAVPPGQLPFLAALDRLGPLSVGDMARAIGMTQPGATKNLAQLAKLGLVTLTPSPQDGRLRVAALTEAGRDLVLRSKAGVWQAVERAARELCARLGGTMLEQLDAIERRLDEKPLRQWGP